MFFYFLYFKFQQREKQFKNYKYKNLLLIWEVKDLFCLNWKFVNEVLGRKPISDMTQNIISPTTFALQFLLFFCGANNWTFAWIVDYIYCAEPDIFFICNRTTNVHLILGGSAYPGEYYLVNCLVMMMETACLVGITAHTVGHLLHMKTFA